MQTAKSFSFTSLINISFERTSINASVLLVLGATEDRTTPMGARAYVHVTSLAGQLRSAYLSNLLNKH